MQAAGTISAGLFVFLALSAFALLAASAVARRASYDGPAERWMAIFMLWSAIILAPIHALGLSGALTRPNLALASFALSATVFAAASRPDWRKAVSAFVGDVRDLLDMPGRALVFAYRARSLLFVGILATYALLAWTAWISYLAPSDGWDGLWYHETMVGFAIQNHGYKLVDGSSGMAPVNAFPRNCEMISLWFVFFTDRRFIDTINNVYAIPVMLGMYCLTRRYCENRLHAVGWACSLVLMPGFALQLHSNYIDIHSLAFYLGALHFATRPNVRLRDGWMTAVCLGLLLGAKSFAIAWTPVLAVIATAGILLAHAKKRPRATIATLLGSSILILALGSIIYVRNWVHYHNPIWPYHIEFPKLGISFPGPEPFSSTDFNRDFSVVMDDVTSPPKPGYDYPDTKQFGYGLAIPFLVLPLAAATLPWILFQASASLLGRFTDQGRERSTAPNLLLTIFPPFTTLFVSRALWLSRYNYHLVAALFIIVSWLGRRLPRIAEATTVACILTGLMWLHWAKPAWFVDSKQAFALARMTAEERATATTIGWSIAPDTARARELELGPGDVVAFSDDSEFYALLWNQRFSNRLVYVPPEAADQTATRLDQVHAKWFVTATLTPAFDANPRWQRVGQVSGRPVFAYRRAL